MLISFLISNYASYFVSREKGGLMDFTDRKYNQNQYIDSKNLDLRLQIYRYNTNKSESLQTWIFNRLPFKDGQKILELACGNGKLWLENSSKIKKSSSIILSDLNEKMLEDCKSGLENLSINMDFMMIDIADIPFEDGVFDIVIANHCLYHLPDLDKCLEEIHRVIKPGGILASSTIGKNDNKELKELFRNYSENFEFHPDQMAANFGLENGRNFLERYFTNVRLYEYENSLLIPESKAILDYARSITGYCGYVKDEAHFESYIKSQMDEQKGSFYVTKETGLFLSEK
jgi:ubiquinone/menaquinone biosynthesis C-methylase UbiE